MNLTWNLIEKAQKNVTEFKSFLRGPTKSLVSLQDLIDLQNKEDVDPSGNGGEPVVDKYNSKIKFSWSVYDRKEGIDNHQKNHVYFNQTDRLFVPNHLEEN